MKSTGTCGGIGGGNTLLLLSYGMTVVYAVRHWPKRRYVHTCKTSDSLFTHSTCTFLYYITTMLVILKQNKQYQLLAYVNWEGILKECMLQTNVLLKHKMVHVVLLKDASFTITPFNSLHNDDCFCFWNGAVKYLSWMFLIPPFFHMFFICGDTHMSFHLLLFNPVSPNSSPSSVHTPTNTHRPSQQ